MKTFSIEDVVRFSSAFSEYLATKHAPNLWHNPGQDKSGPIIRLPGSSERKMLWWKVKKNNMTLQLMHNYQGLAENLDLPDGINLELAREYNRKCDYLVTRVPTVEFSDPFESQIPIVETALDEARKLIKIVPLLDAVLQVKR